LTASNTCSYGRGVEDEVRLWWNGRWGRLAQRRVRLFHDPDLVGNDPPWRVEAQAGDSEGSIQSWGFACEPDALTWADHLIASDGGDGWRQLTLPTRPKGGG